MSQKCFIFFFLVVTLWACGEDDTPLFEMELEADFTIPSGLPTLLTHVFEINDVPTFIEAYTGNPSRITRIQSSGATLQGIFRDQEYGIINNVSIWAVSRTDPTLRKEVFYQEYIELDHNGPLPLFSSLSEVKDILLEDRIDLEIRLIFRSFTPRDSENRLSMKFKAYGE